MITRISAFLLLSTLCLNSALGLQKDTLLTALDTAKNQYKVKALNELFRSRLQSDPIKAIGFTREALTLATEINDQKGMAASYNNLGVAYKNQGALDKALEYYIRSLNIYDTLHHAEGIATTKNNIATIYSIKGDFGQSMKYLESSHAMFVQLGNQSRIIGSLNNLGNLHTDLQLYEKAMRYYSEAYQLSLKMGTPYSDPMDNMGNVYFKQGNYDQAIDHYQKALQIERSENNRLGMLNTITNIGIAYTKGNKPKPAQEFLNEAKKMADELGSNTIVPSILKHSSENLFKLGKVKEAYTTLIEYDSVREKVYGELSSRNIAQMEMALRIQEKEREYEMLRKQAEINNLALSNTRLVVLSVVLVILALLAGVNFFFMGRRKKLI
jgi:tetratricopeptide (TPR) repeat protein